MKMQDSAIYQFYYFVNILSEWMSLFFIKIALYQILHTSNILFVVHGD